MTPKVKQVIKKQKFRRRLWVAAAPAFLRLMMMLLVIGAFIGGIACLWLKAANDPRFLMDGETLAMAGAVRECPESVASLEAIGKKFSNRSLLDPLLLADIEKSYGQSVWIKRINRMRRHFPNRIELEFLIRMPVAQVRQNGKYWLIDADAVLLPVTSSTQPFPALPEIAEATSGVIGKRPGQAGEVWIDNGVAGALGVMRAFWASPLAQVLPIERVVVVGGAFQDQDNQRQETARRYEVVSSSGAVVRWGTFNPGEMPGELTSAEKLWQLQELVRREDANRPGICFDIRTKLPGYSLL